MSRLSIALESILEDLEGNEDELVLDEDVDVDEGFIYRSIDDVNSSLNDIDEIDSLSTEMESYISTGNRSEAMKCSEKINSLLGQMSARHGVEYKSESIQLEGMTDSTWLEYQVESNGHAVVGIILLVIVAIMHIVAFIRKLIYKFYQKTYSSGSSEKQVENYENTDWQFIPEVNWSTGEEHDIKESHAIRMKYHKSVVPHIKKHINGVAVALSHTSYDLIKCAATINTSVVSGRISESIEQLTNEWNVKFKKTSAELEHILSNINGVTAYNIAIFSDNTARMNIYNKYKNSGSISEASLKSLRHESTVAEYAMYKPYMVLTPKKHPGINNFRTHNSPVILKELIGIMKEQDNTIKTNYFDGDLKSINKSLTEMEHTSNILNKKLKDMKGNTSDKSSLGLILMGVKSAHKVISGLPATMNIIKNSSVNTISIHQDLIA